jgi:hypothetical protein
MSVAFDANSTADKTANGVTTADLTTLTVGAGSQRAVVGQIVWSGTVTSPSLTWDNGGTNQAMAAVTGAGATSTCRVELWGVVAPTSGAKTLRASWTTARDIYLNAVAWTGVDQTGGTTSFPNGTGSTNSSSTTVTGTVSVTSAVGNAVMAVHGTPDANATSVNNTQTFLDSSAAGISGLGNRAAGAASVSMTGTINGAGTIHIASAGCDIVAAAVSTVIALPQSRPFPFAPGSPAR